MRAIFMKVKLCLVLFCLGYFQKIAAQHIETDLEILFNKALSHHYINKDSTYFYYEKAIKLADKRNDLETLLHCYAYLMNANGHYYDLKNYSKNIQREDSLLLNDKRLDTFDLKEFYIDYLLFDKGNYHYKIKQYITSKKYFLELYTKINTIPENEWTTDHIETLYSIHSFLGLIYMHTGKYELAAYTFQKNIVFSSKYKDSLEVSESNIYNSKKLLSQVYEIKKEYQKANKLLTESLSFYKTKINDISYKNNFLSTYMFLSKNHIKQGSYRKAIQVLNDNVSFFKEDNPFSKEVNTTYGDAYLGLREYHTAEKYYKKSLLETITFYSKQKHQDIATSYSKFGKLYMAKNDIEKGLNHYQLALMQLEKKFNNPNLDSNPNPKKVSSKTVLISILKEKLEALHNAFKYTNDVQYLLSARNTSTAIINTLDELRPEFESKIDKQFLITETYPSIQKTVAVAYDLFKNTGETKYISDAFRFMEKSKSILLLEAQRNSEATVYGNMPDTIIDKSQQYRANISHIEQELFQSKKENRVLIDSVFSLRNAYSNYLKKIEDKYPKYYDLKYNTEVVSLADIQHNLGKDQVILNYLVSDNTLYLVSLEKDKASFFNIPFNENLKNTIKQLYRKSATLNIQDSSLFTDSNYVYNVIIKEALQETTATDILIIPDDILNYIPFDALITDNKKHSFLLETHSISYASSTTILQEQNKIEIQKKNKLLAFAPQFTGKYLSENKERAQMSPLLYNKLEAENIANYFNTTLYIENEATINNFINEVKNHNIIHFASHASANDEFPDYSYLAFSNTSNTESNLLYVKDLYNYEINADLVTLSACQTGIGKLQKGEGMLSLARAFNYAGAAAIVTTLWKIDDQSTSNIMSLFYENLSNGLNKKEALRQAKLTYLSVNDDPFLRHPYYWSGIIITGNTAPITTIHFLWWFILGGIAVIIIGIVIKKS